MGAKIADMLLAVLSVCSEEELSEVDPDEGSEAGASPEDILKRREEIKNKILAVGKMQKIYEMLREESENATELAVGPDGATALPGTKHGTDALGVQGAQLGKSIRSFDEARRFDIQNERLPQFLPDAPPTAFPASMRRLSTDAEGITMEHLIKKTLEEDFSDEGGVVQRIADRIAKDGRRSLRSIPALKRHGTA